MNITPAEKELVMPVKKLQILCLDFDGVLHSYESGWKGPTIIPDPPVLGAFDFIHAVIREFEVHVYSSRSNQPGGIEAMQRWMISQNYAEHGKSELFEYIVRTTIKWPKVKPPAHVTLDDRCLTFIGKWPTVKELHEFEPWHKTRLEEVHQIFSEEMAGGKPNDNS